MRENVPRRLAAVLALVTLAAAVGPAAAGCGASSLDGTGASPEAGNGARHRRRQQREPSEPAALPVQPLDVVLHARPVGGSLEVVIQVVGRGHQEGEPFEETDAWQVRAADDAGRPLKRVMNGMARTVREPVGPPSGSQWDVTIRYTVYFELTKGARRAAVTVGVPGARLAALDTDLTIDPR